MDENDTIVITSGRPYIDIDAYSACIAYGILLKNLGYKIKIVTTSLLNESISPVIKDLNFKFDKYTVRQTDKFIILDVSNIEVFDSLVDESRIIEIIDHHTGYETHWRAKTNINIEINPIGSVCTIIFEKYEKYKRIELLNKDLCKLLLVGIVDNTLNLKAAITTTRDINAYNELLKIGRIDKEWIEKYLLSCQKEIEKDLKQSIANDMKKEFVSSYLPQVFGQLLVLDKDPFINRLDEIKEMFHEYSDEWMLNLISLKDGKSYVIAEGEHTKSNLEKLLNKNFVDGIMILDRFMLRKEIIKIARERVDA